MKDVKLPHYSDCRDCQAIADGQVLFAAIEALAQREDIDAERMAGALRELLAGWVSVVWQAWPEDFADPDMETDDLADALKASIRHNFNPGETHHVH